MAKNTPAELSIPSPTCKWCHAHFHLRPHASRHQLSTGRILRETRRDHFILWLVVAGHGQIELDKRIIDVHGDEAVITPAGLPTRIHANTPRQLDVIRVPFDVIVKGKRIDNALPATQLQSLTLKLHHVPELALHGSMFSLNLGQRLLRVRHQRFQDVDELDAQIQLLRAIYMLRLKKLQMPEPTVQSPIHRAYAYLLNHRKDSRLGLGQIASHVGLSVSHLVRLFREHYGASPMKVLARERMAHAKRLLATPDFRIAEIARESGFASSAYFCRTFRAEMDMTPREYRQRQLYHALFQQK